MVQSDRYKPIGAPGLVALTDANYYSHEANVDYMSNSQFKAFMACEAAALAQVTGEYVPATSDALLVGGYVDAHFSGTLAQYKALHPEIFKKDGGLLAKYVKAEDAINRIERDPAFMESLSGEMQTIGVGQIGGVWFKTRMDSYHPGKKIVDLKYIASFKPVWKDGAGKVNFVEGWGYDIQGAIYQNIEGGNLPFILAAVTKDKVPDIGIIEIDQHMLNDAFAIVEHFAPHFAAIKRLEVEPRRCERCDYCKATKVLGAPVLLSHFAPAFYSGDDQEETDE
jgi:hypothetical protein